MKPTRIAICGAFSASVTLRPGETPAAAAERFEKTLQHLFDTRARRYAVNIGVDYGELAEPAIPPATLP